MHFCLFNPGRKLRLFSKYLYRGSRRMVVHANKHAAVPRNQCQGASDTSYLCSAVDLPENTCEIIYGHNVYAKDVSEGFCLFRVENALFKVHRWLLLREPSAFADMLAMPQGDLDEDASFPIDLFDTVEQFRDLLWALYAPPSVFFLGRQSPSSISLERVLNILEMANKYCLDSYVQWALECLSAELETPHGPLHNTSPRLLARMLRLTALCDHKPLLNILIQKLIPRLLWSDMHSSDILKVAETCHLTKLMGPIYYKQLLNLEERDPHWHTLSPNQPPDSKSNTRLMAAHRSLEELWSCLRDRPPLFCHECANPVQCSAIWAQYWLRAVSSDHTMRRKNADVLGRLRATMIRLRKSLAGSTSMGALCTLAALESVTLMRDSIIESLIDHFV